MNIAVLMTVHNRKDKTLICLEKLINQSLPKNCNLDVFVTNDGCTDGTREAIIERFPEVYIIEGDGNLYWNRGMYKAWEEASQKLDYDFYLWINDDTILLDDSIAALLYEANEKPDSIIVGSTYSTDFPRKLTYGGLCNGKIIEPNGYLQKCNTFNGNIVLISKYIFEMFGNLDWTYEHAIGDLDYGLRVSEAGLSNYISKDYRGICDRNSRPPQWTDPSIPFRRRWNNYHSPLGYGQPGPLFYFNKKHFGLFKAITIWTSNHVRLFFPILWCKK